MIRAFPTISLAAVAMMPSAAHSQASGPACDLRIDTALSQWQIDDIDAFANSPASSSFDLRLINDGDLPCAIALEADTQGEPFGLSADLGGHISYSLRDARTGADLTPRNGRSNRTYPRTLVIAPHSETVTRIDVVINPEFPVDGIFSQRLEILAYDPKTGATEAANSVVLSAIVPSSATMALSGHFRREGGIAHVNLGDLHRGTYKVPLILHVKSTRAYKIAASSENNGNLALAGTQWAVPYVLVIDGQQVNPSSGIYMSPAGDRKRVDNLKLGFLVTGSTNVAAGRYSDVVTLEISVN